jgi:hypothetical protein
VPADKDEGAGGDMHYVTVEQDPDQSPEVCVSACADEGKPRFIHLTHVFTSNFWILLLLSYVHLRSGVDWNPSCMILKYLWSFTSMLGR